MSYSCAIGSGLKKTEGDEVVDTFELAREQKLKKLQRPYELFHNSGFLSGFNTTSSPVPEGLC